MNGNAIRPIAIGIGIFIVVTIPFWLPCLLSIEPKNCECGVQLTSSGISPYCKCEY